MKKYVYASVSVLGVSLVTLLCFVPVLYASPGSLLPALTGYGLVTWGFSMIGFIALFVGLGTERMLTAVGAAGLLVVVVVALTQPQFPAVGFIANASFLFFVFVIPLANVLSVMQLYLRPPLERAAA